MKRRFDPDASWTARYCPGCGANAARPDFLKENVPYLQCYVCRTVFVSPVPPSDVFARLYNEDWADFFRDAGKVARDFNPDRFWREWAVVPDDRRGALLDVGCATGSFLMLAQERGFRDVRGIDVSAPAVAFANEKLGADVAISGDFTAQPFGAESFDVVTLWATLEHVPDPEAFVREAHRVLKPGGTLCVSVPNRDSLAMRLLGAKYHMVGLEHVNYFTRRGLGRLLERCGLRPLRETTRGFNPVSFARDYTGRHLLDAEWGAANLLDEGARNASLRERPWVRVAERVADRVVWAGGVGELLITSALKP